KDVELYGETVSMCLQGSSCEGRCGSLLRNTTTCSCDAECSVFGDCCYDVSETCQLVTQNRTILQHETTLVKETMCFKTDPENFKIGYHVISTCSNKSSDTTLRLTCEQPDAHNIIQQILVTDYRGNVYRNIYCAACDGIKKTDVVAWHVAASCNSSDVERHLTNVSTTINRETMLHKKLGQEVTCFSYKYTPPTNNTKPPRPCHYMQRKETCAHLVDKEQVEIGCAAYSATVYADDTAYKNPHCAI
ncbi:uncharacterized protein LOC117110585, partial [Anneissia japonica]|uniref:uncharacterized protein LOC117110585 n=1 Tax=Anneissia japonica TaxID=1529436 RepID=UPI001425B8E8